ncbi:rhodanese-like domain-containing protein [Carboxylicivirga marina]|uniref:Rhodanese-like domain-containing protein n=1 Tax=Carboxylicivirga marina TaxID=2800988 RepID=A0ABS1HLN1_9BACT|nr:rhodanese-like domain-containing protein [Carboxylicivirga marina]MBK3518521.1 rhodanese-like domain-containing protein [Carboxylicivirga marina]
MKSILLLIGLLWMNCLTSQSQSSKRVNAKLFYSLTQKHPQALIIDVRPSEKFAQYRIKNALPAPEKNDLLELTSLLPKTDTIFIYCEKDIRTQPAAETLCKLGYTNIIELKGGLISWRRNDLPIDNKSLNK